MKKSLLFISAVMAVSSASATLFGTDNSTTANGGSALSNATGGSVLGSGNSANTNTNVLGQQQGQAQGQQQGQAAIGVGIGGQGGAGGSASAGSSSSSGSTASNGNMIGGSQAQDNRTDVDVTVEGAKTVYEAQARNPVSTAYAPSIAPTALCALGISGGAQGVSFGLSFGKSYVDENCQILEQIRATATVLGDRVTAAEMMCDVPAYKAARERTGKPCGTVVTTVAPTPRVAPAVVVPAPAPAPAVRQPRDDRGANGYTGNDPYVLARMKK